MKKNIDKEDFILHTKYLAGPMTTNFVKILLPIGTEFFIEDKKFIVKYHELTQAFSELESVLNPSPSEHKHKEGNWTIEMVAYEVKWNGDIWTEIWRNTMLGKLEI